MRRLIGAALIGALLFSAAPAHGETKKPTPRPTVTKKTATAKPKVTAKPKATVSSKPKTTAKPSSTKAATAKKKVVVKKKRKKKKAPPLQPEAPLPWPPVGFTQSGDVYAKVPSKDELSAESSKIYDKSKVQLRADLTKCYEYACGAVTVASETSCDWWEITSVFEKVSSENSGSSEILGRLRTISEGTKSKRRQSIMLISEIKGVDADGNLRTDIKASQIVITCHRDSAPDLSNRNIFTPSR